MMDSINRFIEIVRMRHTPWTEVDFAALAEALGYTQGESKSNNTYSYLTFMNKAGQLAAYMASMDGLVRTFDILACHAEVVGCQGEWGRAESLKKYHDIIAIVQAELGDPKFSGGPLDPGCPPYSPQARITAWQFSWGWLTVYWDDEDELGPTVVGLSINLSDWAGPNPGALP